MGHKIIDILKKIRIRRTTILVLAFLLMSITLVRQLFQLQIIQGQAFINSFQSRTTKTRVIKSARGKIFDRNGELVAYNVLSYSLTLEDNGSYESTRQKNLELNSIAYRVLKILEKNGDGIVDGFHIKVDETGEYAFDVSPGFTLSRFKADIYGHPLIDDLTQEEKTATAADMIDFLAGPRKFSAVLEGSSAYTPKELASVGLPEEFSRQELLDILIIRYLLSTNSFKKYMPVTIATDISEESVAAIMENQAVLQGIEVVEDSAREYVDEISMGPILGYTGKASAEELSDLRKQNPDYTNDAIIGKAGIEQYMETTLQGTDGKETVTVDNLGKVLRIDEETQVDPVAGKDVQLTIDTQWQSTIYEILKQHVAGILLSKIEASKEFDYEYLTDASQIVIPVYDVYNALVQNSVVDVRKFSREDASETEKKIYKKFQSRQDEIFEQVRGRLTADQPAAQKNEPEEMQDYLSYICNDLLRDNLMILSSDAIDTGDAKYRAWEEDQSISLKEYLTYAASQNWLDISVFSPEGDYLDSEEVYQALTDYVVDYLKTDYGFTKLLYHYMIMNDEVSGKELCLCLYEQGVLDKTDDDAYERLSEGSLGSYDFIINKVSNMQIEPAQLALKPCSASAVVVDVHTGETLACVSYPGYDNNRLANDMDTDYYAKLALDLSSPFFNKATQQRTAPGSTFKLLSAIAGMTEGVIDDNTYFSCTGSFDFVQPPINCWNKLGHGPLEIREAIQESCNYFFDMIGFQLGKVGDNEFSEAQSLRILKQYCAMMGMDKKSGLQLSEASPHVSDSLAVPSYMGQGNHLYTTSQLARYAAALANKGTVYNLTLLDKVLSPTGEVVEDFQPDIENEIVVGSNVWDDIHDGMERVVATHSQFDQVGVSIAGKTGTAETVITEPNHGLFIGFAPSYDPQYAVAVRIANGYTSGNACLVAADLFDYIFKVRDRDDVVTGYASEETSNTSND